VLFLLTGDLDCGLPLRIKLLLRWFFCAVSGDWVVGDLERLLLSLLSLSRFVIAWFCRCASKADASFSNAARFNKHQAMLPDSERMDGMFQF